MIFATIYENDNQYTIIGRLDSGADVQLEDMTEALQAAAQTIAEAIDAHKDPELLAAELRAQEAEQAAAAATSKLRQVFGFVSQWAPGLSLTAGQLVWYDATLFSVVQSHTSQADWLPSGVPSLYTPLNKTNIGGDAVLGDWVQPSGPLDAYNMGDRVRYDGKTWECRAYNVVHAPGVEPGQWEVVEA